MTHCPGRWADHKALRSMTLGHLVRTIRLAAAVPAERTLWLRMLSVLGTRQGVTLALAWVLGVAAAAVALVFRDAGSPDWPRDAAQLIATLLIAVAIEGRQFGGYLRDFDLRVIARDSRDRVEVGAALALACLVIVAEVLALTFASTGDPFPRAADALVTSILVALVTTVVIAAILQPPETRGRR